MLSEPRTVVTPLTIRGGDGGQWPASLVGGKGAGLFWMAAQALPVPPFFVVTTEAWRAWRTGQRFDARLQEELRSGLRWLEQETGRTFGGGPDPLLVSVRSSGPVSMPGMMDTVLNLGLTPASLGALLERSGSLRFVSEVLDNHLAGLPRGSELAGLPATIEHIFASWDNDRAILYRKLRGIDDGLGTAVVVQAMVFGNLDAASGTGVLFTRDPVSGSAAPAGDWIPLAQGEAVVAGRVTPGGLGDLERTHPAVAAELVAVGRRLERADGHPQDIEFTVESGQLYVLQTRRLRLTPLAACRVIVEQFEDGALSADAARARLADVDLDHLAVEVIDERASDPVVRGIAASPGVATGRVVRDVRDAIRRAEGGEAVVLVRVETNPNDLAGMRVASAIVTERGGATSHAAIVARDLRVPCVVGCGSSAPLTDDAVVTVDGSNGEVYAGTVAARREIPPFARLAFTLRDGAIAEPDAEQLDVLLWIAQKGLPSTDEVDARLRGGGSLVGRPLLTSRGWLAEDDDLCYLTEAGDAALTEMCRTLIGPDGRDELEDFVVAFEGLDRRLKTLATEWQNLRSGDDADALMTTLALWFGVDDELADLVARHPVAARLIGRRADALRVARQRFEAGEAECFTGIGDDSYHSIWYVLHEMLLRALGKQRDE